MPYFKDLALLFKADGVLNYFTPRYTRPGMGEIGEQRQINKKKWYGAE
jgi:hypothetical protein